jgi:hypothetical protein
MCPILDGYGVMTVLNSEEKVAITDNKRNKITSSFFGPNILLNALFSDSFSLCSFLNFRDQVLHPYGTTGKSAYQHNRMLKYNII